MMIIIETIYHFDKWLCAFDGIPYFKTPFTARRSYYYLAATSTETSVQMLAETSSERAERCTISKRSSSSTEPKPLTNLFSKFFIV